MQGGFTPDGMIIEMHGPFEGRTRDTRMLRESGMLGRLQRNFPGFCVYGDKGYDAGNPSLQIPFKGANTTQDQRDYNRTMSDIRQPVEWAFGKVVTLFGFIDLKKEQQAPQAAGRGLLPQHRPPHELLLQSPDAGPRGLPPQRVISVNSNKRTEHRIVARCSLIKLLLLVVLI